MAIVKKTTFEDYMQQRVFRKNMNLVILWVGIAGGGKSYSCISKAESYCKLIGREFDIRNCCFTPLELMERINSGELKRGDVLILEEAGVNQSSRSWYSSTNKLINYLIQTFRNMNLVVFLNTIDTSFLDAQTRKMLHFIFECITIDHNKKVCKVKPLMIQVNKRSGKIYQKYLRVIVDGDVMPLHRLNIPLPSKELVDKYEVKKRAFTDGLNKQIFEELQGEFKSKDKKDNKKELTLLQEQTIKMLMKGMLIPEIAKELGVIPGMVYSHIKACKKKGYDIRGVYEKGKVIAYRVVGYE